jgi:two-component system, NtrC family, nitrogen regulation sensor histidine kinase NtrY
MFTKRTLHILLTMLLLALLVGLKHWYSDGVVLTSFARTISVDLATHTQDFETMMQNHGHRIPSVLEEKGETLGERPETLIRELAAKPYTFFTHRNDEITFWNSNADLPHSAVLRQLKDKQNESIVKTPAGYFYILKRSHAGQELICMIPVKYEFGSNKLVRPNTFPASGSIPDSVLVHQSLDGAYLIRSASGAPIASISAAAGTEYNQLQRLQLLLFVGFVLLYFSLAYGLAAEAKIFKGPLAATLIILSFICIFFTLKKGLGITSGFESQSVFSFSLESVGSLGDLLLYLGIGLWLMIFFHKEFTEKRDKSFIPLYLRMGLASAKYLMVMMSILMSLLMLKDLVRSSNVVFDFDNLFNLDIYNLLLIGGVIMMMGAMFLYSHKLMDTLSEVALGLMHRSIAMVIAGVIFAFVFSCFPPLDIDSGFVIFFTLLYVAIFDQFVQKNNVDFYWILGWIGLYSFYAANALYQFNWNKDILIRKEYAMKLAENRDTLAEIELPQLQARLSALATSKSFKNNFSVKLLSTSYDTILEQVHTQLSTESYLNLYYKPEIAVFSAQKSHELDKRPFTYAETVDTFFNLGQTIDKIPNVKHYGFSPLGFRYTMHFKTFRLDSNEPLDMYVSLIPKSSAGFMVYNNVFFDKQHRGLELLERYDYVIFDKNKPVSQKGRIDEKLFDPSYFPKAEAHKSYVSDDKTRADLLYTNKGGDVTIAVGRTTGDFWKKVYLSSAIFTVLCFFMFCLVLINTSFKFLPAYYNFYIELKGSLTKRIQYYTVMLIMFALVSVGVLTYFSLKDSSQKNDIVKHDYLSLTFLKNVQQMLKTSPDNLDSQLLKVTQSLPQFVALYGLDVDLYTNEGKLVSTSAEDLKQQGLLQEHMDMDAMYALSKRHFSESLTTEKTSGITYNRRYYPLRNTRAENIGYLGIPYYLPKYNIHPDNSDFVGKVLTVFVVLLIAGVIATHHISQGIINPLTTIINQMKAQRIQDQHVPIVVDSYGEELVTLSVEYNNLIHKIKDFTKQLAEVERDKAWREMAAMVAHEIKNAMTTIKLSLQNVHEAKKTNDQATVNKFLDKAIYRNLMQVESLSRIAKDFGDFSMLQVPRRYPINLNKSVRDIYECFEEEDKKAHYTLDLPKEPLYTEGDEDSFIRVINNLMLNAKEAIPDDREKHVDVKVYRENDRAIIRVIDNGMGIPEYVQTNIFTPRFSTKSSGTGLGLSICKQIIEALGGKIYFETTPDVGTHFVVELPVLENPDGTKTFENAEMRTKRTPIS